MPSSAAVYARISEDRSGAGLGVARQEQDCRAWADRNGWTIAEVYVDDDVSAYSGKRRPAYQRLLEDIDAGRRDGLIVWHPDRLHRSPRELEGFISLIERTGIPVGTVTAGDLDLTSPTGRMTARIVGAVARHESEHKGARIRRKHLEMAENGRPGGGLRSFGYERDGVTVREAEAELVREAARRVLAGDGLRTVAADWTARGVPTVTGAQWSATTLKRLLRSGRIVGWRTHHGVLVAPATWPALIDVEDGRRLRALLDDPARTLNAGRTARSYLLSGMIRCGRCGAGMTAAPVVRNGRRIRRYSCLRDRGGCNRCGILADPLEEIVVEAVLQRLDGPALGTAVASERDRPERSAIEILQGRLDELTDMLAAGDMSRAAYARAARRVEADMDAARAAEAADVRRVAAEGVLDGVLRETWPTLGQDRQRLVLAAVLNHVTVAPTTKARNRFDPDRIDVVWRK